MTSTAEEQLIQRTQARLNRKKQREATVPGLVITMIVTDLIVAWALMVLLGIVAIATGASGLALGYWVSLGVCQLLALVVSGLRGPKR